METRPPPTTGYVGREAELTVLQARLVNATGGAGGVVLLAGEPGIGKTRTAEEIAAYAVQCGAGVLWGRCYEGDGAPAFWPWVQAIRGYIRGEEPEIVRELMGRGAGDIAQVVPEVRDLLTEVPIPQPIEPEQARFRFFDSVTTFLKRAAARRPLLLLLDDLHWADRPSLLLLQFLASELGNASLLILGTYRDTEVSRAHPLAPVLAGLTRERVSERLVLRGLQEQDIGRFITEISGQAATPSLVQSVFAETEGNPFFVTEVVRLLASEGRLAGGDERSQGMMLSRSVREVIEQRLERLTSLCRDMLTAASVLGRDFDLIALERSGGTTGGQLVEAIEEAEQAQMITPVAGARLRYRFVHALTRETLYAAITPARRAPLHRQVGIALERLWQADLGAHLAELAHHFTRAAPAGDVEKAVDYARRAGDRALDQLAYEEAAAHYARALEVLALKQGADDLTRCDLLLALGGAWNSSGNFDAARDAFRQASAAARQPGSAERLAAAAIGFGRWSTVGTVNEELVQFLEEALERLGESENVLRVRVQARLAEAVRYTRTPGRRAALTNAAVAGARRLGDPLTLAQALMANHILLWGSEQFAERLVIASETARMADQAGAGDLAFRARTWCIAGRLEVGDIAGADREIESCAAVAGELPYPYFVWVTALARSMRALLAGELESVEQLAEPALAVKQPAQQQTARQFYTAQLVLLRREQGRLGEVEAAVRTFAESAPAIPSWRCVLALLLCELGRFDEASQVFEGLATDDFAERQHDVRRPYTLAILAEVCACLGDRRRAHALYELLLPYEHGHVVFGPGIVYHGATAHYLGLLAASLGHSDDATRHFDAALAMHARVGAGPWLARSQYEYAAALQRAGGPADRERALRLVGQSFAAARELGLTRLAAQAQTLRVSIARSIRPATGRSTTLPSPRTMHAYPGNLSDREVEVLRLLAGGKSNQEIADALVLSLRTVERHISNIYGKIGAHNRADATAFAIRNALLTIAPQSHTT